MWAHDYGHTERRRLEHIVPANGGQASADESDVSAGVEDWKLAHRIAHEHVHSGAGVGVFAAAHGMVATFSTERSDLGETFGMTWHDDEEAVGY